MLEFDLSGLDDKVQKMRHDILMVAELNRDDEFLREVEALLVDNFERVFDTKGGNLNEDWGGRDGVETGTLKISLTTLGRMNFQIVGDAVIFSSDVSYASDVNNQIRFYGTDDEFDRELGNILNDHLRRKGLLQWS